MNPKQFKTLLDEKGITLSNEQLEQFNTYYEVLVDYNQKINLTSLTNESDVYLKHFYDSLSILLEYELKPNATICDVGAGAGFPSVPLKIIRPDLNVTIVDSLGKRCDFLKHLFTKLNLSGIQAIHSRAEDYALEHRETFDYVTARAVARLNILAELCIPLVREGGEFIALKGSNASEEYDESVQAIHILGCKEKTTINLSLPMDSGERTLFIFEKRQKTPKKYPRSYGKIKKSPL